MSDTDQNKNNSLLSSLKRLVFEDEPNPIQSQTIHSSEIPSKVNSPVESAPPIHIPVLKFDPNSNTPPPIPITANDGVPSLKEMKLKVLNIMEKLNQPGIDFFEVWNAAAAMGKVDENSLKAAFTSFQFIDKSLNKEKLINTGNQYANAIKNTIAKETESKKAEIEKVILDKKNEINNLSNDIETLTSQIAKLQLDLTTKKNQLEQISQKYEPILKEIEEKIQIGNQAVNETIADINVALTIIDKSIN